MLTKECVELQGKNAESNRMLSILRKENEELKERNQVLLKELSNSQVDYKCLLDKQKKKIDELKDELKEKDESYKKSLVELSEAKRLNNKLKEERDNIIKKYDSIQIDLINYSNTNSELIEENRELNTSYKKLDMELKTARSGVERLKEYRKKLQIQTGITNISLYPQLLTELHTYKYPNEEDKCSYNKRINESFPIYNLEDMFSSRRNMQEHSDVLSVDQSMEDSYLMNWENNLSSKLYYQPKHNYSVVMDSADEQAEIPKIAQSYYATSRQFEAVKPALTQRIENQQKYRNCLLSKKSKWYEDRNMEIGLIRTTNEALKLNEYKLYFGNKSHIDQIFIIRFSALDKDSNGSFLLSNRT